MQGADSTLARMEFRYPRFAAGLRGVYDLPMADIDKLLAELRAERDKIDLAIQLFSEMQGAFAARSFSSRKRRGRKGMSSEERQQVSVRMRHYWAQRRRERRGLI